VATVGRIEASPGATNVIAGICRATLDVRHPRDDERRAVIAEIVRVAEEVGLRRRLLVDYVTSLDQPATQLDGKLVACVEEAVAAAGLPRHRMHSGAGHDAMIIAPHVPVAMMFVRNRGGISHHPDEFVSVADVAAMLKAGAATLEHLARSQA
jgi:allantoate deiminase